MNTDVDIMRSVLKYVTGETECLCRLCFDSTEDSGVYLEDNAEINGDAGEVISHVDMLQSIGVTIETTLPFMLCSRCSEDLRNCYLFTKKCEKANSTWTDNIEKINKTLDVANKLGPNTQSVYLIMGDSDNVIFTSRKRQAHNSKKHSLNKVKDMLKSRKVYQKTKKRISGICTVCGEQVPSKAHLEKHMKKHSNQKNPCPQCHKVFTTKSQLDGHIERLHQPKRVQCPKCSKMFSTEKMLRYHDQFHHIAAICKLCFVQFPSKKVLRQHLDKHNLNKCPQCEKSFMNKHTFKSHLKICGDHTKEPQFFCDICHKGYARKNGLRTHLKTDHGFGNVYTCNWCSKKFDAISRLKNHIVKHTKEKNFHCEHCSGKFVTQQSLVYHIRLHTGEKPFPCSQCEETFLSASRRAEHMKRKHIGPTQECTVCQSKFYTSNQLRKHVARHKNPKSRLFVQDENGINNNPVDKPRILYF